MAPQLPTYLIEILRLSLWLAILVAIFVPLERLFAVHPRKVLRKGILTDLGYYFLSGLATSALLSLPIAAAGLADTPHHPGGLPGGHGRAATVVPPGPRPGGRRGRVLLGDRWSHRDPLLWRFHAIHHSAEEVDFLVNTRAHPVNMVFGRFCGMVPIFVLGLGGPTRPEGSTVPILVGLIGVVWGFFIHANLRWRFGPLEWIVSSPAFHHWHHTKSGPINRNYASTLPWLDWVFGSLYLPREWPSDYGITAKMPEALIDATGLSPLPTRRARGPTHEPPDQRGPGIDIALNDRIASQTGSAFRPTSQIPLA